jgi:hypothetical protein
MRYVLAKSTRHLMWRIRTLALIISIVLVFGLRLYLRAEEGTLEGKEVAIQAGMVVTLVATEDIMEVIPATRVDGLQAAQRRGAIS